MPGLPHAGSMQLSAWMQGAMEDSDSKYDLVDALTNCRAVIACTSYRAAKGIIDPESPSYISDTALKYLSPFEKCDILNLFSIFNTGKS